MLGAPICDYGHSSGSIVHSNIIWLNYTTKPGVYGEIQTLPHPIGTMTRSSCARNSHSAHVGRGNGARRLVDSFRVVWKIKVRGPNDVRTGEGTIIFRILCISAPIVSPFLAYVPNLVEWQYIHNTSNLTQITELESLESARRSQIRTYSGAM
jgi:hypothetical protein